MVLPCSALVHFYEPSPLATNEGCRQTKCARLTTAVGLKIRIEEKYTWKLYSERLMTLTGVYGFWKYVSNLERRETRRYLEMLYALKYRTMASTVPLAVEGDSASK
ncbi:sucrose synthase 2-like [Triticum dicoccoides]|uniref:sucrose synthase 2-like n=1 Tax=Triticum dicoccoides TaxID=85692 RepID=UPI00188E1B5F|nr:sucrose synthase 2-like [Triticum dicoccoides]